MKDKNNKIILCLLIVIGTGIFGIFGFLFAQKSGIADGGDAFWGREDKTEYTFPPEWEPARKVKDTEQAKSKTTHVPTSKPTHAPTSKPTHAPTSKPTHAPTSKPTHAPTSKPTHAPTQVPTYAPTEKTVPTQQVSGSVRIKDSDLSEFVDIKNGISCMFPASFVEYGKYNDVLYVVQSLDCASREIIDVEYAGALTAEQACDTFISDINGTVVIEDVNHDSYEVQIHKGNISYYKYCIFYGENMYWFEFINPVSDEILYRQYREAIKKSLTIY